MTGPMNDAQRAVVKAAILASLSNGVSVMAACRGADISLNTYANWRNKDAEFAEAAIQAKIAQVEVVESSLYKKALEGNTTAMIFWLCNRAPGDWRHVQHIQAQLEHSGAIDMAGIGDLTTLTDEQLAQLWVQLKKKAGNGNTDTG